jgi:ABC-type Fe3+ transport system substrate-binding protein
MNTMKTFAAVLALLMFTSVTAYAADDWDKVVAAAKKEGEITVSASSSELLRQVLMTFSQDYPGIKVSYQSGPLRDFWVKVEKEREVGQHLWDVRVGGVDASTYKAKDRGWLDPIQPLLLLPEVKDDRKWMGGISSMFGDKERKHVLVFAAYQFGFSADRDVIPEKDLKGSQDLLDPRWKGKIVMQDPSRGGAGNEALAAFILKHGEQFARDLLTKQAVVISDNKRQMAEWVVRKRYPIAIGLGSEDTIAQFQKEGLGKNVKIVHGGDVLGGEALIVLNKAPHPNATKVFVNWLLSQKTQDQLGKVAQLNSRRLDVKPGNAELAVDAKRIASYYQMSGEASLDVKLKAQQLGKELVGK